jgi:hypothetical protein
VQQHIAKVERRRQRPGIPAIDRLVPSLTMSAADETTTRPPLFPGLTWVQLYRGDQALGCPMPITGATGYDICDLRELVKAEFPNDLEDVGAPNLVVYPHGTPLNALNEHARLSSGALIPDDTTSKEPLIVIAPERGLYYCF